MKRDLLSTRKVQSAKSDGKYGGYLADGGGLYLQISAYGTKSWVFRYTRHGKQREMGLGRESDFSLKEARERAKKCRQLLVDGIDPLDAKQAKKDADRAAAAARITFEDAAKQYIKAHAPSWKNAKHRQQWPNSLAAYVYPVIGKLSVDQVGLPHVSKILDPIWLEKPETASRLRGRIERVLAWATMHGYRSGDNPARWTRHLDTLLPAKTKTAKGKVKHYASLSWAELPAFMAELRERNSVSARALEFLILTGTRTNETLGARWSEIDFKSKVWSIPAVRMKGGLDYRVPLCARALEILNGATGDSPEFVFVNGDGKALPDGVMLNLLRSMRPGLTVHGFRSTLTRWGRTRSGYSADVVEMALSHKIKNKVESAYMQDEDLIEKRTGLMRAWCQYCSSTPVSETATVVSIKA
jgi:integrase